MWITLRFCRVSHCVRNADLQKRRRQLESCRYTKCISAQVWTPARHRRRHVFGCRAVYQVRENSTTTRELLLHKMYFRAGVDTCTAQAKACFWLSRCSSQYRGTHPALRASLSRGEKPLTDLTNGDGGVPIIKLIAGAGDPGFDFITFTRNVFG
jgi:hypothetical protein